MASAPEGGLTADAAQAELAELHAEVDRSTAPLAARHQAHLKCKKGCADCCVDDLTVFEVEAERIRRAHPALLAEGTPHAEGACAFLNADGDCRIYPDRPYVCRTQGLPLRWEDETPSGDWAEHRDICTLNDSEALDLVQLPTEQCWTLGPIEGRLATLQVRWSGRPDRVRLRELFEG